MADNGVPPAAEEDPAAAFLAQQESEIAGIENDGDGFGALEGANGHQQQQEPEPEPEPAPPEPQPQPASYGKFVLTSAS